MLPAPARLLLARVSSAICFTLVFVTAASAGQAPLPPGFTGPPPPVAPEVMSLDDAGQVTVRAVRIDQPLRVDGAFDEALYRDIKPITGMFQVEPFAGEPATERTEIWLSFDEDNLYVSVRCFDTSMDRLVATEMRRDSTLMFQGNDIISIIFDPFYDRRNTIAFTINPLGGRSDGTITNERQYSSDWNPVWTLKTGRFDGGWTVEAAYPFKSLRYQPGRDQVWGFNLLRIKRSKNEVMSLTKIPPGRSAQVVQQASNAAAMVGLQVPPGGRTLDLKPFATSNVTTDRANNVAHDPGGSIGLDAKYSITQNLTADMTVNTDFAQVEADEQQINLTRFSLFFPEKRDFFLENQGTFSFGGVAGGGLNAGGSDAPILFYSRRIGLNRRCPSCEQREIPLDVGGRLSGRSGRYSFGVLNIETGDEERTGTRPTNFTVLRAKRDILRKSSVGIIGTNRSRTAADTGSNQVFGVDSTLSFFQNLQMNTYWTRTLSPGTRGRDTSYRFQVDYPGDRYGVQLERLDIGPQFNPEVGFVRRRDMRRNYAEFAFTPRPSGRGRIRKYTYEASLKYIENWDHRLDTREQRGEFGIDFQNADHVGVEVFRNFDRPAAAFDVIGLTIPAGGYDFSSTRFNYNMGQQRRLSANLSAEHGSYYGGHKTTLSAARGRLNLTNQLSVEPTYTWNRLELPQGTRASHLAGSRVTFTMTPLMFVSALIQYNSATHSVSTNARLRWEYGPGSELFVVYNDERNTLTSGVPDLATRAVIVKINRLFRF
jgi:hypothetical protein